MRRTWTAIASREDLNQLFREMTGHLSVGHTFVGGGTQPKQDAVGVGLLGADYRVADGRYQFARILSGENWNPKLQAPLTQPGVDVKAGEFLLAVNGQDLRGQDDVFRLFQATAGQADGDHGGPARRRQRFAPGHGGAGRLRGSAPACAPGWRTTAGAWTR